MILGEFRQTLLWHVIRPSQGALSENSYMADVGDEYNTPMAIVHFFNFKVNWKHGFMNVSATETFCAVILSPLIITEKEEGDFYLPGASEIRLIPTTKALGGAVSGGKSFLPN